MQSRIFRQRKGKLLRLPLFRFSVHLALIKLTTPHWPCSKVVLRHLSISGFPEASVHDPIVPSSSSLDSRRPTYHPLARPSPQLLPHTVPPRTRDSTREPRTSTLYLPLARDSLARQRRHEDVFSVKSTQECIDRQAAAGSSTLEPVPFILVACLPRSWPAPRLPAHDTTRCRLLLSFLR